MSHLWFNLPVPWKLNDVQAVLNVVISVLATVGIFSFARFCWQRSTAHLTKQRDVPVSSLLTVNSPGEAYSVLRFLLHRSFTERRYRQILYQSIVIIGFSVAAMLSGPIANSASRRGQVVLQTEVKGSFPDNAWSSQIFADVEWNETMASLDRAGFPLDQLLDFIPDLSTPWVYRADEWNNTWHAKCKYVPQRPLTLYATANYTGDDSIFNEIPGLLAIVPLNFISTAPYWYSSTNTITVGNGTLIKDALIFYELVIQPDEFSLSQTSMTILIAAVHVRDAPAPVTNNLGYSNGTFGKGPIGAASYTRMICEMNRNASTAKMNNVAFPNVYHKDDKLTDALCAHYDTGMSQQSTLKQPIHVPPGPELFRFYQSYIVSKDTQDYHPGTRTLSVMMPTVQLSTIFLAVVLAVALLILAGLLYHFVFVYKHRSALNQMPESKLDWLLQSLREAERVNGGGGGGGGAGAERRRSMGAMSEKNSRQSTFDNAMYRHRTDEFDEDGKKVVGEVVIVEDDGVEMIASPQILQVNDKATLLDRPGPTGWHYCGGHHGDCSRT